MHDNAIVGPHARLQAHVQKLKPSTEHGQAWSIEVLKEQIASMRGRELPGFPKPEVMSLFVRKFVADWREPTGTLIKEVQAIVLDVCRCSAVNQPSLLAWRAPHNLNRSSLRLVQSCCEVITASLR